MGTGQALARRQAGAGLTAVSAIPRLATYGNARPLRIRGHPVPMAGTGEALPGAPIPPEFLHARDGLARSLSRARRPMQYPAIETGSAMDGDTCRDCGFSPLSTTGPGPGWEPRGSLFDRPAPKPEAEPTRVRCDACEGARSLARWVEGGCVSPWRAPRDTFVAWVPEMTQSFASIIGKVAIVVPRVVKEHERSVQAGKDRARQQADGTGDRRGGETYGDDVHVPDREAGMAGAAAQGVMALTSFLWGRRADEGIVALGRRLATPTECRSFVDGLRVFDDGGCDEFGLADGHASPGRRSDVAERWLAEGTMGGLTVGAINRTGGYLD